MQIHLARESPALTIHLIPSGAAWRLVPEGARQPVAVFDDLGLALDAAAGGPRQVRVVVHARETA